MLINASEGCQTPVQENRKRQVLRILLGINSPNLNLLSQPKPL